ncbi:MAG: RNA-binding S4 domain-containing protein [Bacteroidetes bacterium]|nr:MAG: RNA-binding S4 domain-containing protein [Bacteroidota bacterium]
MLDPVRIDKWLWAVRLFKTRSQATDACRGGKVKIDGHNVKPSREMNIDDVIEIQSSLIKKKIKVLQIIKNRVAAKLVPDLAEDQTPAEEYERLDMQRQLNHERREHGIGRPTKKDRRDIDKLKKG